MEEKIEYRCIAPWKKSKKKEIVMERKTDSINLLVYDTDSRKLTSAYITRMTTRSEKNHLVQLEPIMMIPHKSLEEESDTWSAKLKVFDQNNGKNDEKYAKVLKDIKTSGKKHHSSTPTKSQLASKGFGKPSLSHLFLCDKHFDHIVIFLLKQHNLFSPSDFENVLQTSKLYRHLWVTMNALDKCNFSTL